VIILAVVVVVGFFVSRSIRLRVVRDRPKPEWRRTDEVFNDASTNRVMRVWLDPAGERHYLPEETTKR
jgi:hypothetical protein